MGLFALGTGVVALSQSSKADRHSEGTARTLSAGLA